MLPMWLLLVSVLYLAKHFFWLASWSFPVFKLQIKITELERATNCTSLTLVSSLIVECMIYADLLLSTGHSLNVISLRFQIHDTQNVYLRSSYPVHSESSQGETIHIVSQSWMCCEVPKGCFETPHFTITTNSIDFQCIMPWADLYSIFTIGTGGHCISALWSISPVAVIKNALSNKESYSPIHKPQNLYTMKAIYIL